MSEAEAAGRVAAADEVDRDELVQRRRRGGRPHLGHLGADIQRAGLAEHRSGLEQEPRPAGEGVELALHRGAHRRRHAVVVQPPIPARHAPRGARELLEVERVPAALDAEVVQSAVVKLLAEQRARLGERERRELERAQRAL
jgi:hypothetical protein